MRLPKKRPRKDQIKLFETWRRVLIGFAGPMPDIPFPLQPLFRH